MLGNNDITVTATALQGSYDYIIKLDVGHHVNPRTPPQDPGYCEGLGSYEERSAPFSGDAGELALTFTVPLSDWHYHITAGFTLLYWTGEYWVWNGDERASEGLNIWSDCLGEGCTRGYWRNLRKHGDE